jgi:sec-independent protein translocase protein TatB
MLDIGFAELLVISALALFVVGPERLPSAIRSISLWLGRVRRGFEEIKSDVSRELHNEEVMRALKESRDEVQDLTDVSSALSLTENSEKSDTSLSENAADSNASELESNTHLSSQTDADDPTEEIATVESAVKSPAEVESTFEKGA